MISTDISRSPGTCPSMDHIQGVQQNVVAEPGAQQTARGVQARMGTWEDGLSTNLDSAERSPCPSLSCWASNAAVLRSTSW